MKRFVLIICLLPIIFLGCNKKNEETKMPLAYASFGEKITNENVLTKNETAKRFFRLQENDTINLKFKSTINEVCKKKGCWMKLDLSGGQESMVRFKDYGFFVPKDIDGKEVIVEGKAYVTKISVDQLKHYAKDGGKSEEENCKNY